MTSDALFIERSHQVQSSFVLRGRVVPAHSGVPICTFKARNNLEVWWCFHPFSQWITRAIPLQSSNDRISSLGIALVLATTREFKAIFRGLQSFFELPCLPYSGVVLVICVHCLQPISTWAFPFQWGGAFQVCGAAPVTLAIRLNVCREAWAVRSSCI